jgi:hypothetical protein
MRHRRSRSPIPADWPSPVQRIVRAATLECPRGHARALADFATLAVRKVPSRGIFDPTVRGEHELFSAIEAVADAHLQFSSARDACRTALDAADLSLKRRDEIERALLQLQSISDTAYFYAGLAFGLVSLSLYDDR